MDQVMMEEAKKVFAVEERQGRRERLMMMPGPPQM
jgi:hypothetical protein